MNQWFRNVFKFPPKLKADNCAISWNNQSLKKEKFDKFSREAVLLISVVKMLSTGSGHEVCSFSLRQCKGDHVRCCYGKI